MGASPGVKAPPPLFVFSCSRTEQPGYGQSARRPRAHTGGRIAYTKICLLSRVCFSTSALACKDHLSWQSSHGGPRAERARRPQSSLLFAQISAAYLHRAKRRRRAATAAAFVLRSQSRQQFFFTSETELMLCLAIASGHKAPGLHLQAGNTTPPPPCLK